MSLPNPKVIRENIERIQDKEMQMILKAIYLFAAIPRELTGKLDTDATRHNPYIYGPKGSDVRKTFIELPDPHLREVLGILDRIKNGKESVEQAIADLSIKIPIAVFTIKIAKRRRLEQGEEPPIRQIALPLDKEFEPWTEELYNYFKEKGNDEYVFNFRRSKPWYHLDKKEPVFQGLLYSRQRYHRKVEKHTKTQLPKLRKVTPMVLRYIRERELMSKYDFSVADLREYTGMKLTMDELRLPVEQPKMLYNNWHRYIKKLCRAQ